MGFFELALVLRLGHFADELGFLGVRYASPGMAILDVSENHREAEASPLGIAQKLQRQRSAIYSETRFGMSSSGWRTEHQNRMISLR